MFCCEHCIGDRLLTAQVFRIYSTRKGKCDFCGDNNIDLIEPEELRDKFESLISTLYKQDDSGRRLSLCLKEDWDLFNHKSMSDANSQRLLAEILDDGQIVRKSFISIVDDQQEPLEKWKQFKDELKNQNRFFLKSRSEEDKALLIELLEHLSFKSRDLTLSWHRARVNQNDAIPLGSMGAPPQALASHGRANPAGIPYLYVASDIDTAISEIRPHTGAMVSVAEFLIDDSLDLIDLRNPKSAISPFLDDEEKVLNLSKNLIFLSELGRELTRPVLPHAAVTEYLPSQYLCELIKHAGFHGVVYNSSVGNGMNLALFDQSKAQGISVCEHYVSKVAISSEPIP
jgi:hypothetical protein